jgi:hypothetical protein
MSDAETPADPLTSIDPASSIRPSPRILAAKASGAVL